MILCKVVSINLTNFKQKVYHLILSIYLFFIIKPGGTLDECRKALIVEGAQYVSCYVTHAIFPRQSYKKFLPGGQFAGMNRFYVTNTNPAITDKLEDLTVP